MRNCAPGPQLEVDDLAATSPELLRFIADPGDLSGLVCVAARVNGRTAGVAACGLPLHLVERMFRTNRGSRHRVVASRRERGAS